ncbi:MAG TPA: ammonium transporter [Pseudonocardia sp.]
MINAGDTAWVLASAALVMLMTPGLAFFYGGMVRSKSVLNMLMMNFITLGIVGVLWELYGFSLAFGNDAGGKGLIGNLDFALLHNTIGKTAGFAVAATETAPAVPWPGSDAIPVLAFCMFQLMFAVITPALASGAIADRAKFIPWSIWVVLWVTICYFPVAHWVFSFDGFVSADSLGGWIANGAHGIGALDFAGGTAVHINAGAAGLALCLVLGKRKGWPREPMRPHNLPFVLLGASLLWFGWFGFNAGSALTAGDLASVAFTNTMIATSAALIGWLVVEKVRDGKPTTLGAASGAVAGLVAITPACGYVSLLGGMAIGFIAGAICALAVGLKYKLGFDDSLDVVGVHLVGGIVGTLLIGFFGSTTVNSLSANGLFYGGGLTQLWKQAIAAGVVMVYSFVTAFIFAFVIQKTIGFRADVESEVTGVDEGEHAETAYDFSTIGGRASAGLSALSAAGVDKTPDAGVSTSSARQEG